MSALRNVEDNISGFVDRIFGRMFRGYVEPVELARKLAREMEDHKTVSVSRVYVPNEYVIYLSQKDHGRFASFEASLTQELAVYVGERARHEGFTLLSKPIIRLETDSDLRVGEYGVACRVVDPPAAEAPPAETPMSAQENSGVMDPTWKPAPPPLRTPIGMDDDGLVDVDLSGEISDRAGLLDEAAPADVGVASAPEPPWEASRDSFADPVPAEPEAVDEPPPPTVDPAEEFDDERHAPAVSTPLPDPDEPDPFLEPASSAPAEEPSAPSPDDEGSSPAPVGMIDASPSPFATPAVEAPSTPSVAEPIEAQLPDPPAIPAPPVLDTEPPVAPPIVERPEPTPPPEQVIPVVEPVGSVPVPPPPAPAPPPEPHVEVEPPPLPTPGGYEPLAGVSGTQIFSASDARDAGLVHEEMALVLGGRRYPLTKRASTMGRSRDCDIVVPDPNASRHHAEIRHIGLDYFLVDAGSTNGTMVNGQRVRRHPLADGDTILIGTTEIVVEYRS